jgi:hypothetical protein
MTDNDKEWHCAPLPSLAGIIFNTFGVVTPLLQVQKEESLKKLSLILNFEF